MCLCSRLRRSGGLLTGCPHNPGGNGAVDVCHRLPGAISTKSTQLRLLDPVVCPFLLLLVRVKGGQDVGCNLLTLDGVPVLGLV